jgi:hypothetical protein
MNFRKIVSTAIIAAMFFWAPSVIPARALTTGIGCGYFSGVMRLIPTDTALADMGIYVPCPAPPGSPPIPWVGIIFGASVVSVILNAAIVGRTQCRELTLQEALQSVFMPFIGIAFNQHNNMCNPVPQHHRHH